MHAKGHPTALLALVLGAGSLGVAASAASCAASGSGTNEVFDASTTDTGTGVDSSTSGDDSGTVQDSSGGSTCDADTQTDYNNCGMCGHKCGPNQTCSCGTCTNACPSGQKACCGTCADTTKDPNNCGTCGNICLPPQSGGGIAECQASQCTFTCQTDAGFISCGADAGVAPGCYDPTRSNQACGGCGKTCSGSCVQSQCCPQGSTDICSGTCSNTQSDPSNCGSCGHACASTATCTAGMCVGYTVTTPTMPFVDACTLPNATTVLRNANGGWLSNGSLLNLPITFSFYGKAQTQFWLQNQGALGIGNPMLFPPVPDGFPLCQGGSQYPENLYPAAVAFGEGTMATGASGVCYAKIAPAADAGVASDAGDAGAPGPQFVVTWEHATLQDDPGSDITVTIILTQGTNTIDFQYETVGADGGIDTYVGGSQASVGLLQGNGGTNSAWPYCMQSFIPSNPYTVRFSP